MNNFLILLEIINHIYIILHQLKIFNGAQQIKISLHLVNYKKYKK